MHKSYVSLTRGTQEQSGRDIFRTKTAVVLKMTFLLFLELMFCNWRLFSAAQSLLFQYPLPRGLIFFMLFDTFRSPKFSFLDLGVCQSVRQGNLITLDPRL